MFKPLCCLCKRRDNGSQFYSAYLCPESHIQCNVCNSSLCGICGVCRLRTMQIISTQNQTDSMKNEYLPTAPSSVSSFGSMPSVFNARPNNCTTTEKPQTILSQNINSSMYDSQHWEKSRDWTVLSQKHFPVLVDDNSCQFEAASKIKTSEFFNQSNQTFKDMYNNYSVQKELDSEEQRPQRNIFEKQGTSEVPSYLNTHLEPSNYINQLNLSANREQTNRNNLVHDCDLPSCSSNTTKRLMSPLEFEPTKQQNFQESKTESQDDSLLLEIASRFLATPKSANVFNGIENLSSSTKRELLEMSEKLSNKLKVMLNEETDKSLKEERENYISGPKNEDYSSKSSGKKKKNSMLLFKTFGVPKLDSNAGEPVMFKKDSFDLRYENVLNTLQKRSKSKLPSFVMNDKSQNIQANEWLDE